MAKSIRLNVVWPGVNSAAANRPSMNALASQAHFEVLVGDATGPTDISKVRTLFDKLWGAFSENFP